MIKIENLYQEYKTERKKDLSRLKYEYQNQCIQPFVELIKDKDISNDENLKEIIRQYQERLFQTRDQQGFYFTPKHIWLNLIYINIFLNWLVNKNYIQSQPFKTGIKKSFIKEYERKYEERRKIFLNDRYKKISEEEILNKYFAHISIYFCRQNKTNLKRIIELLLKYKGERLFTDLTEKELEIFRESLFKVESCTCRPITDNTIIQYSRALKWFYQWLYEEGFIEEEKLKDWTYKSLNRFVKKKRKEEKEQIKQKIRYYNPDEIIRAYNKHLEKTLNGYLAILDYSAALKTYIRYLAVKEKTLYTADEQIIEDYKKYLLNCEYFPKRHYSATTQVDKLKQLKRFYEWFLDQRYILKHPLENYKAIEHYKWIIEQIKDRRESEIESEVISEFKEVYINASDYELTLNLTQKTLDSHRKGWRFFFEYLKDKGISNLNDADEILLNEYQIYLRKYRDKNNEPLKPSSHRCFVGSLVSLFKYLCKFRLIERNPMAAITLPKYDPGLSTAGLKDHEVRMILNMPDTSTETGIRDRTFFEVLYSGGMRANELANLKIHNIDLAGGMARIDVPKGGKKMERIIPIGDEACYWLKRYINEVRSKYDSLKSSYLFLNKTGLPYKKGVARMALKKYLLKSKLKNKKVVIHSFRVSCGTEMLKRGADLKYVQMQLGHRTITSTERYMRLVPCDLKKAHRKYHPRAHIMECISENRKTTENGRV